MVWCVVWCVVGVCGVLWWCVVVVCCGGACVWCVVKLGTLSLLFSLLPLLFPFLFLSYLSFSLAPSLVLALVLSLSLLSSFLPSRHSSLLFPSRQQTLYKALINNHTASNFEAFECDVAHGTFIATANVTHVTILPPSSLLPPSHIQKKRGNFLLQEYFRRGIYFFITVLNKFQKIAAGENYSHYSFILIPKQLACNASKL